MWKLIFLRDTYLHGRLKRILGCISLHNHLIKIHIALITDNEEGIRFLALKYCLQNPKK